MTGTGPAIAAEPGRPIVAEPGGSIGSAPSRGGFRSLDSDEIDRVLRRNWWGVLSTAAAGQPYAVPVAYGLDGRGVFHAASRDGRKVENLRANPNVCLTVTEVESGTSWCSIVVVGSVEWAEGAGAVVESLAALRRQCGVTARSAMTQARRLAGARFFRIVPAAVTGRAREGG